LLGDIGNVGKIFDCSRAGIASVAGIERVTLTRIGEKPVGRAVAKDATFSLVLIRVDKPDFGDFSMLPGNDLTNGVHVELEQLRGPRGQDARIEVVHFHD
jgi:hypothetical protein